MQQVGKFLLSIGILIYFTGCSYKSKEPLVSTQIYKQGIAKDQLLDAAKKVFILSDKEHFIIDSYRDKVHAIKPRVSFTMIDPIPQSDYFDFSVEEDEKEGSLSATLSISRENTLEEDSLVYVDPKSISHKLFWERIDFLLGIKNSWPSCHFIVDESFLCDMIDLEDLVANKDDVIQKTDFENKKEYNQKTINLSDILYKNRSNTMRTVPENQTKAIPIFKEEKKGIEDDPKALKSFNLKDIKIEERKPSKKTKSLNKEEENETKDTESEQ